MRRPLFIARQAGQPTGVLGWLIGWIMSKETAPENRRALDLLEIQPTDNVLEIGFGHGQTLARAAELACDGHVAGVEVSARMVEMATARNEEAARSGRVELHPTDGLEIPYEDATFDKAYTVHTIYFWENPGAQLREIHRVLKPGGRFVLVFRYSDQVIADLPAPIYRHRTPDEVVALLGSAGFRAVHVEDEAPLYFVVSEPTGVSE